MQRTINTKVFESLPVGTKFEVCSIHNHTLRAVYVKVEADRVHDVGDGRQWGVRDTDALAPHHYLRA
jgi:hypothetical protein